MTRSNQITISFGIEIGISVDTIQGTSAEKKIIAETDTTAMTNFTTTVACVTNNAGKNISAILNALAFATIIGSGNCRSQVNG